MAKKSGNDSEKKDERDDELDALFRLPVAEFTAARNVLATQLKKSGRRDESDRVKALVKPSVTAWAVNQLYWQHRHAFDRLIAAGQRFRQAQTSSRTGKVADMREALDARREALAHLSDLASALLSATGSNPTPEMIHRISTTLEAISAYASFPDTQRPGRLTRDVDPPGFDSMASLLSGVTQMPEKPVRVPSSPKPVPAASTPRKEPTAETSQSEQRRQAKIAAAKGSLQEAKSLLMKERTRALSLETAQKKANAEVKETEKHRLEVEERLKKAQVESEAATKRAQSIAAEAKGAVKAVEAAERSIEKASKELEKLLGH